MNIPWSQSDYARVLNLAGIQKVLNMRENALENCLNICA